MRRSRTKLPRILIIDDQFGRCSLGKAFRDFVGPDLFRTYQADRENLCRIYGIFDGSGDSSEMPYESCTVAGAFCPGQRWHPKTQVIENDIDIVRDSIRRGWPFKDGERWGLVLLDLRFVYGKINEFGDPQTGSVFGLDTILPMIRREFGNDLPVVVLSSTPKDENNAAIRTHGALDFIQRVPGAGATPDEGRATLQKALFFHGLIEDTTGLVIGKSLPILKMLRQARRGAMSTRNMLLLGETGTGKGLLAKYIHQVSTRSTGPFEVFHAAHRPAELQADELFGHWKGAFTGADADTPGIWELANGGTLFIDEVADIDIKVQQALMQPIEERRVRRIGTAPRESAKPKAVDVLVILATNRDLNAAKANGTFKGDFLNRINAFTIEVPSLRERREDIPLLVKHLTVAISPGWQSKFLPDAMDALSTREWKEGNIRELRNVIDRAITNNPGQDITAADVAFTHIPLSATEINIEPKVQEASYFNLAEAILKDLQQLSLAEVEDMKRKLPGTFPDLLAKAFAMALQLTQANGKLNPTSAVRFLLGNNEMTTVQAKQFIKRLLMLDTQGKSVWTAFEHIGIAVNHTMLQQLIAECQRPRRSPSNLSKKAHEETGKL